MIDILLGTHNGEKYLPELLNSILDQTFQDFKLIIRDDLSQDKTRNILQNYSSQYPEKIELHYNDSGPFGAISNFSELLALSDSQYIMLADQDDIWLPEKIEKSYQAIISLEKKYSSNLPLLIHTDLVVVDENLNKLSPSFWNYAGLVPTNLTLNRLLVQNVVTGCTTIFNKALAELAYPIPPTVIMHDHWLALVASALGKIELINESTILYRQHTSNMLGANKWKWNIWHLLKRGYQLIFNPKPKIFDYENQAILLRDRIKPLMEKKQMVILQAFIQINTQPYFHRKFTILKFKFLKGKWPQNIGLLIRS